MMNHEREIYERVSGSILLGVYRLGHTEIVARTMQIVFNTKRILELKRQNLPEDFASDLQRLTPEQMSLFTYVVDISLLAYVTTLLDTFLSETTKFLFLLNPGSVGDDISIPFRDVLAKKSRPQLIVDVVEKKTREVSYLPFIARIGFLRKRFGLRVALSDEVLAALEHYGTLRNTAIHDQGIFLQCLDENYRITLESQRCPMHPTPISSEDYSQAAAAFLTTAQAIHEAVVTQVLNAEDDAPFRPLLQGVINAILPAPDGPTPSSPDTPSPSS
jgi:hypothetical protein